MKTFLALYRYVDDLERAVEALRERGIHSLHVLSPVPLPELEDRLIPRPANVRWYTLLGAIAGISSALALTIWTSVSWPVVIGGKPIVSIPPYIIITFELMVLFGSIMNLLGLFARAKLPRRFPRIPYHPAVTDDRFALVVDIPPEGGEEIQQVLQSTGAEEVHHVS